MGKQIKFIGSQMIEFEVFKLVDQYDSILKQKLPLFDFSNPPINPSYIVNSLVETMNKNHGVGLSANQVGLPHRVFVMGANNISYACFNPVILETQGEDVFEEGCLSVPGLYLKIKRPTTVRVRFQDSTGTSREETFTGLTAKIFHHELDHLNGVLYTTKVSPIILDREKRHIKKNLKRLEKMYEQQEKEKIIQQAAKNIVDRAKANVLNQTITANIPKDLVLTIK